jgi:regulator of nucleoside diphosphate kinase
MPHRKPLITHSDHRQLMSLLQQDDVTYIADPQALHALRIRLETALLIDDDQIPATVVTMESVVQVRDTSSFDGDIFTLVFPNLANIKEGKLSIFAPVGVAMLGRHVGQIVRIRLPSGQRQIEIADVLFQPQHSVRTGISTCRLACPQSRLGSFAALES